MNRKKTVPHKSTVVLCPMPLRTRLLLVVLAGFAIVLAAIGFQVAYLSRKGSSPSAVSSPARPAPDGSVSDADQAGRPAPKQLPKDARAVEGDVLLAAGRQALAEGKSHQAVAAFRKACVYVPESSEAWLALIHACTETGDLSQAWQSCERALGSATGDLSNLHRVFARLALDCGKPDPALAQAMAVLRREPEDGEANLLAALATLELQRVGEALSYARKAVAVRPDDLAARVALGRALVAAEQPAEALPILTLAVAESPGNPEISLALARAQRLLGDEAAAQATLAQVQPQSDNSRQRLVEVLHNDGETLPSGKVGSDQALAALAAAERAELLLQSGDTAAAIAAYEDLATGHPDLPSIQYRLAELYLLAGQFDAALKLAKAQLARLPGDPGAHTIMARIFLARDLPALAIEPCREALKVTQQTPITLAARKALAMALNRTGQSKEAVAEMQQYLRHRPDDLDAVVRLSGMLVAVGDRDAALAVVQQASARVPSAAPLAVQESLLLHQRGEDEAALAAMRRAVELGAKGIWVRLSLAALLIEEGHYAEALPIAREVRAQAPRNHLAADTLAWCLISQNRLDEAVPHIEAALRAVPDAPRYHYHRAVLFQRQGKPAEAIAELRVAVASTREFPEREAAKRLLGTLAGKEP